MGAACVSGYTKGSPMDPDSADRKRAMVGKRYSFGGPWGGNGPYYVWDAKSSGICSPETGDARGPNPWGFEHAKDAADAADALNQKIAESDATIERLTGFPLPGRQPDPATIIRNLIEHAVYDRARNDECIAAVEAAEAWLEGRRWPPHPARLHALAHVMPTVMPTTRGCQINRGFLVT